MQKEQLKKYINKAFELIVKNHWLKVINKEVDKYNKINRKRNDLGKKLNLQSQLIHALIYEYNKLYKDDPIKTKPRRGG